MVTHSQIKRNIATAIAGSEAVRAFCVENFGRGALVIVDWFGSEGAPGVSESPFVFVYSSAEENDAGMVDEQTFKVSVVVGGCIGSEPSKNLRTARTDAQNGLVINGVGDKLESMRTIVEQIVLGNAGGCIGATARTVTRIETSTNDYPLEWARSTFEFYEPETI